MFITTDLEKYTSYEDEVKSFVELKESSTKTEIVMSTYEYLKRSKVVISRV